MYTGCGYKSREGAQEVTMWRTPENEAGLLWSSFPKGGALSNLVETEWVCYKSLSILWWMCGELWNYGVCVCVNKLGLLLRLDWMPFAP
jgi:hypothetical protein